MRDVLAGFGLPFSRFAFSGATAGLLGAAAELMAVKVSGHSCGHLKVIQFLVLYFHRDCTPVSLRVIKKHLLRFMSPKYVGHGSRTFQPS